LQAAPRWASALPFGGLSPNTPSDEYSAPPFTAARTTPSSPAPPEPSPSTSVALVDIADVLSGNVDKCEGNATAMARRCQVHAVVMRRPSIALRFWPPSRRCRPLFFLWVRRVLGSRSRLPSADL